MSEPTNEWCAAVLADASLSYMTRAIVLALAYSADTDGVICESPQSLAHEHRNLNPVDVFEHWNAAIHSEWLAGYQVQCVEVSTVEAAQ